MILKIYRLTTTSVIFSSNRDTHLLAKYVCLVEPLVSIKDNCKIIKKTFKLTNVLIHVQHSKIFYSKLIVILHFYKCSVVRGRGWRGGSTLNLK